MKEQKQETGPAPASASPSPARTGFTVAVVALIIALASAALAGWLWWHQRQGRSDQLDLAAVQAREIATLEAQLDELREGQRSAEQLRLLFADSTGELRDDLARLHDELTALQSQLAQRPEDDFRQRRAILLLNEAEALLRMADSQLQLRRDPDLALKALNLADRRLAELDEPGVGTVREVLAQEIQALENVPDPDLSGISARLAALAEQTATWPLRRAQSGETAAPAHDDAGTASAPDSAAEPAPDEGRWAALMDRMGRSLGRLVRVQKHDQRTRLLLTPNEERLLRENLRLKFETARLALLERRGDLYREILSEARAWLTGYFEEGHDGVSRALEQLDSLQAVNPRPDLPTLSAALRELRRLRDDFEGADGP